MIEKLEKAIEKIKQLPDDRQIYAAMLLDELAASGTYAVPAEHRPAVLEGLSQAQRGERASDAELVALWKKCGL